MVDRVILFSLSRHWHVLLRAAPAHGEPVAIPCNCRSGLSGARVISPTVERREQRAESREQIVLIGISTTFKVEPIAEPI
jgi:hypothetical protein